MTRRRHDFANRRVPSRQRPMEGWPSPFPMKARPLRRDIYASIPCPNPIQLDWLVRARAGIHAHTIFSISETGIRSHATSVPHRYRSSCFLGNELVSNLQRIRRPAASRLAAACVLSCIPIVRSRFMPSHSHSQHRLVTTNRLLEGGTPK